MVSDAAVRVSLLASELAACLTQSWLSNATHEQTRPKCNGCCLQVLCLTWADGARSGPVSEAVGGRASAAMHQLFKGGRGAKRAELPVRMPITSARGKACADSALSISQCRCGRCPARVCFARCACLAEPIAPLMQAGRGCRRPARRRASAFICTQAFSLCNQPRRFTCAKHEKLEACAAHRG
jgi:hypothetical protein